MSCSVIAEDSTCFNASSLQNAKPEQQHRHHRLHYRDLAEKPRLSTRLLQAFVGESIYQYPSPISTRTGEEHGLRLFLGQKQVYINHSDPYMVKQSSVFSLPILPMLSYVILLKHRPPYLTDSTRTRSTIFNFERAIDVKHLRVTCIFNHEPIGKCRIFEYLGAERESVVIVIAHLVIKGDTLGWVGVIFRVKVEIQRWDITACQGVGAYTAPSEKQSIWSIIAVRILAKSIIRRRQYPRFGWVNINEKPVVAEVENFAVV